MKVRDRSNNRCASGRGLARSRRIMSSFRSYPRASMRPRLASLTPRKVVLTSSRKIHAALRWVHRWIGLTLGLIFVVVAASGTLLFFQPQFFRLAYGEMIPRELPGE